MSEESEEDIRRTSEEVPSALLSAEERHVATIYPTVMRAEPVRGRRRHMTLIVRDEIAPVRIAEKLLVLYVNKASTHRAGNPRVVESEERKFRIFLDEARRNLRDCSEVLLEGSDLELAAVAEIPQALGLGGTSVDRHGAPMKHGYAVIGCTRKRHN